MHGATLEVSGFMERAAVASAPPSLASFSDGLGERRQSKNPTSNETLETLCLRPELASVPAFEFALRERVSRLSGFRHECYGRVRSVERLTGGTPTLGLVSDLSPGVRLSEVLARAERRGLPVDIGTALCLIRQLVPAVAALHETVPDVAHGAIAPERLVITPNARLVVVEHTLGAALEQVRFSRDRYWRELRVALPPTAGTSPARFDHRLDVTGMGLVALSLILGRPLRDDEFPSRIGDVVASTWAVSARGGFEPLPPGLRGWLGRTLQLDSKTAFASAIEAKLELDKVLGNSDLIASPASLEAFLARYRGSERATSASPAGATVAPTPVAVAPPASEDGPPAETSKPESGPTIPTKASDTPMASPAQAEVEQTSLTQPNHFHADPVTQPDPIESEPEEVAAGSEWPKRRVLHFVGAAAALAALVWGGAFVGQRYLTASPSAEPSGTLVVTTSPDGATATVDGEIRGTTPLTLVLAPGEHVLTLQGDGEPRTVPITISAGSQVNQYFELAKSGPASGQIQVHTDPPGARVLVDGVPQGPSPALVSGLPPGDHEVVLESDLGSVRQRVKVEPGTTASLVVPMTTQQGGPASGWIAVTSPIELQLFEGNRLLGSSLSDRIMVSAGRHEIKIVHEAFGYEATRVVQVTAGKVTPFSIELPQGTLALNAVPWAEVWIDGERVGETPIGNVPLSIGPHDIVFRHPELGEQHQTAQVTLKGVTRASADLRRQ